MYQPIDTPTGVRHQSRFDVSGAHDLPTWLTLAVMALPRP